MIHWRWHNLNGEQNLPLWQVLSPSRLYFWTLMAACDLCFYSSTMLRDRNQNCWFFVFMCKRSRVYFVTLMAAWDLYFRSSTMFRDRNQNCWLFVPMCKSSLQPQWKYLFLWYNACISIRVDGLLLDVFPMSEPQLYCCGNNFIVSVAVIVQCNSCCKGKSTLVCEKQELPTLSFG